MDVGILKPWFQNLWIGTELASLAGANYEYPFTILEIVARKVVKVRFLDLVHSGQNSLVNITKTFEACRMLEEFA